MSLFLDQEDELERFQPLSGVFDSETARRVQQILQETGKNKPLLVLDAQVFEDDPTQDVLEVLVDYDYVTYTGYALPISLEEVKEGAREFLQHDCDCLLAIGGGSTMDLAKLIGLVAYNNHPWSEFFYNPAAGRRIPLLVAVPTSFGGSESSTEAFVLDFSGPLVRDISRDYFVPAFICYDERYIATLPKVVVVANLLTMFLHLLELYIKGKDVEELLIRLGLLGREVLEEQEDAYAELQKLSFDVGKKYRTSGYGFLSGLSQSICAYTELPVNLVKAAFLPLYLRYELSMAELENISALMKWPSAKALLTDMERAIVGSGIQGELDRVKSLVEEQDVLLAHQGALTVEGERDLKGITPQALRQLIKEVFDY